MNERDRERRQKYLERMAKLNKQTPKQREARADKERKARHERLVDYMAKHPHGRRKRAEAKRRKIVRKAPIDDVPQTSQTSEIGRGEA